MRPQKNENRRGRSTAAERAAGGLGDRRCGLAARRRGGAGAACAAAPAESASAKSRQTSRIRSRPTGFVSAAKPLTSALSQITLIDRGMPRECS